MYLTRLKQWRNNRAMTVRELHAASGVAYPAISLLENLKREAQPRTAKKLAAALDVKLADLYDQAAAQTPAPAPVIAQPENGNEIVKGPAPTKKPTRAGSKQRPLVNSFWVIEQGHEDDDPFRADSQAEAERLKERLGGQHQARVYEAASKFAAWEQHRQFLINVIRGHDAW